ncbi:MAG: SUMF1/EgtB/PvdO family nonheme iron enzyme, partial [Deltaproteobacteria bacterium]|nr:SUMF1/EgtB/PvdO family nonheme iron enzyme [Deltaproteobacteria bacterium]
DSEHDGFAEAAPVGSFPQGDSPFGLSDLAGNVWEWIDSDGGEPTRRELRGAAWSEIAFHARASRRFASPAGREPMNGVRCAMSAAH